MVTMLGGEREAPAPPGEAAQTALVGGEALGRNLTATVAGQVQVAPPPDLAIPLRQLGEKLRGPTACN